MESLVLKSEEWGGSVPITCVHVSERVSTRRIVQRVYCITFVECWTNVEDVGPTLYKCSSSCIMCKA